VSSKAAGGRKALSTHNSEKPGLPGDTTGKKGVLDSEMDWSPQSDNVTSLLALFRNVHRSAGLRSREQVRLPALNLCAITLGVQRPRTQASEALIMAEGNRQEAW
jgi:hypothetical protein